ncbi:MAG TPA: DUF3575 domain-containing protein [Chitinophagaceae bacterium]|nr:DUF3575 domain-containing protein [Chitinophagaceae bacterium]
MRKTLLTVGCLFLLCLCRGQDSKWSITFTPAIVQAPYLCYGIQPGVEYRFNERFSLLTEFAFTTSKSKDLFYSNNKFFRVKPELRYTLRDSDDGLRAYTGFQVSYSYRGWQDNSGGMYYEKKMYADSVVAFDKAHINSSILTWSVQLGTPFSFGNHLGMDIFMGLGMRFIFTNYSDVQNGVKDARARRICTAFPVPDPAFNVDGTVTRFHSNFGIRFFYRF